MTKFEYLSAGNPFPATAEAIHYILSNADGCIDSEVDNFSAIADLAIEGLKSRNTPTIDMLMVWEHYCDNSEEQDKLPCYGANECRQYVIDHMTAFCNHWWDYVHSFLSYEDSFDWEFLPTFLGALPSHDIKRISMEQITVALTVVDNSNSFKNHENKS